MFNLNSVAIAFNLTVVEAGSYKDVNGFVLTYRPSFNSLSNAYGIEVASTSYTDAEDLFYSLLDGKNIDKTVTKSMTDFLSRLYRVKETCTVYSIEALGKFVTVYEDKYSSNTLDEIKFFAEIRKELSEEALRLGGEESFLNLLYNVVDESLFYRKQYVS